MKIVKNQINKQNYDKAFTLAEVLITMAIIGLVAAITIPSLVQKYQEKARVTALKKAYSVLNQAVQMAVIEHGTPDMWGLQLDNSKIMLTYIMPYIKHAKLCGEGDKCHASDKIYWRNGKYANSTIFNGSESDGRYGLQLADGMIIASFARPSLTADSTGASDCSISLGNGNAANICGEYMVDVNGSAGPNTYGKDVFIFNLVKSGTLIPVGARNYTDTRYTFDNACLIETATGWGCTGWVIENGNMDYWHCNDLSWDGKHSCK